MFVTQSLEAAIDAYKNFGDALSKLRGAIAALMTEAETRARLCLANKNAAESEMEKLAVSKADVLKSIQTQKSTLSGLEIELIAAQTTANELIAGLAKRREDIAALNESNAKAASRRKTVTIVAAVFSFGFSLIGTEPRDKEAARQVDNELRDLIAAYNDVVNRIYKLRDKIDEKRETTSKEASELFCYQQKMNAIISKMNDEAESYAAWEFLRGVYTNVLIAVEVAGDAGDGTALDECFKAIINYNKHYKELTHMAEETGGERYINGCVYRGNAVYRGQKLYPGEYVASVNRKFVAVMQEDGNFVVYNSERPLWSSGTYGTNKPSLENRDGLWRVGDWNTKRAPSDYLVMQNDGNLVACAYGRESVWASDTWMNGNLNTKPFPIPYEQFDGTYQIQNVRGVFMDVFNHNQDEGAVVVAWESTGQDNQKFEVKRQKDGSHTITAKHSGKAIVMGDDSFIVQKTYNGESRHHWYLIAGRKEDTVNIVSAHTASVIDVKGGVYQNGTRLWAHPENDSDMQMFKMVKIDY